MRVLATLMNRALRDNFLSRASCIEVLFQHLGADVSSIRCDSIPHRIRT
jgi:hypothetical protein